MPHNIEDFIHPHRAAEDRRDASRGIWDHRLPIKNLLTDDNSDENARHVGAQIAAILRASSWFRADPLNERYTNPEVECLAEEFEDIEDLDHFNTVMDRLYDLADADRVWIG